MDLIVQIIFLITSNPFSVKSQISFDWVYCEGCKSRPALRFISHCLVYRFERGGERQRQRESDWVCEGESTTETAMADKEGTGCQMSTKAVVGAPAAGGGVVVEVREKKGTLRAAIPTMPFPLAVICLFLNTFIPGLGESHTLLFSKRLFLYWILTFYNPVGILIFWHFMYDNKCESYHIHYCIVLRFRIDTYL